MLQPHHVVIRDSASYKDWTKKYATSVRANVVFFSILSISPLSSYPLVSLFFLLSSISYMLSLTFSVSLLYLSFSAFLSSSSFSLL